MKGQRTCFGLAESSPGSGLCLAAARLTTSRRALAAVVLALALAGGVFAWHYALELKFSSLQTFKQYDVLFDSDPNIRLVGFAHGWWKYNRNLLHPNLANFVNPPIRSIAWVLHAAGVGGADLPALRESLALMVDPLVSALGALAVLLLFVRLGFSLPAAFLLSLFSACSFSQVIFGSIPEHYALSGLILTLTFLAAADLLQRRGQIAWPAWVFLGLLAAGITVTNLALVALLFWIPLRLCRPAARPLRLSAILVLSAMALTFASAQLLNLGYDPEPQPVGELLHWSDNFVKTDIPGNFLRFPTALADSLAPPEPARMQIRYLWPRGSHYHFQFTLIDTPLILSQQNLLGTALFLLLAAGALGHFRGDPARRALAFAALAVIAYNGVFHALWGNEYFLYSQHWLPAAIFLAAGILNTRPPLRRAAFLLLAGLVLATALNNYFNVQHMLNALAAAR